MNGHYPVNGHNVMYIVLFGNERYHPDAYIRACKHKFARLPDARKCADNYSNAYVFKCKFFPDTWDLDYVSQVW